MTENKEELDDIKNSNENDMDIEEVTESVADSGIKNFERKLDKIPEN